jgi:hypothetical protein
MIKQPMPEYGLNVHTGAYAKISDVKWWDKIVEWYKCSMANCPQAVYLAFNEKEVDISS